MTELAPGLGQCPACRARNLDDARFCSRCGARLSHESLGADSLMPPLSSESLVTDRTLDAHTDSAEELFVADPLIGVVVADRYRILERLGRGGWGSSTGSSTLGSAS